MKFIKDEFDTAILEQDAYKMTLGETSKKIDVEHSVQKVGKGIIFCFTPCIPSHIAILEGLQFSLVSIRSTYRYAGTLTKTHVLPKGYGIKPFTSSQPIRDKQIRKLAANIHAFSRYHKDHNIAADKSLEIYIQWIKNSLFNGYAKESFLAWLKEEPIGICTIKIKDNQGFIDLLGVLPGHQDKKIGKELLARSIEYLLSRRVDDIFVVTEGENIKANIFYQKNHFVINNVELVYHKHITS